MDRRSFIGVAAGALSLTQMPPALRANLEGKKGLRLSITWGMLDGMPVPEAMALLNRLGYDAYEMFDWRNPATLETFVAEKGKWPLFCACLVANKGVTAPGCGLVNPRERQGFLRELGASMEAAKKMEAWIANGVELGWLVDPYAKVVHIYEPDAAPRIETGSRAAGSGPVKGFVLDLEEVWRCYE